MIVFSLLANPNKSALEDYETCTTAFFLFLFFLRMGTSQRIIGTVFENTRIYNGLRGHTFPYTLCFQTFSPSLTLPSQQIPNPRSSLHWKR